MSISQMLPEALAAKYREFLKPFEGHTQEILDLLALHPHIALILDSRIVDNNLDVPSPPNGYYVQWEAGWKMAVRQVTITQQPGPEGGPRSFATPVQFGEIRFGWSSRLGEGMSFQLAEEISKMVVSMGTDAWHLRSATSWDLAMGQSFALVGIGV